jgi:hypothetical protein
VKGKYVIPEGVGSWLQQHVPRTDDMDRRRYQECVDRLLGTRVGRQQRQPVPINAQLRIEPEPEAVPGVVEPSEAAESLYQPPESLYYPPDTDSSASYISAAASDGLGSLGGLVSSSHSAGASSCGSADV